MTSAQAPEAATQAEITPAAPNKRHLCFTGLSTNHPPAVELRFFNCHRKHASLIIPQVALARPHPRLTPSCSAGRAGGRTAHLAASATARVLPSASSPRTSDRSRSRASAAISPSIGGVHLCGMKFGLARVGQADEGGRTRSPKQAPSIQSRPQRPRRGRIYANRLHRRCHPERSKATTTGCDLVRPQAVTTGIGARPAPAELGE